MNVGELLDIASGKKKDPTVSPAQAAGRVVDALRPRGATYQDIATLARKHGIATNDWETLLYEADELAQD